VKVERQPAPWVDRIVLASALLAALLLRLYKLGHYSLWLDETLQYTESTYPLRDLYQKMFIEEMPLSFLIGKVQNAVGLCCSAVQLRLTSAIAGTAVAGVVYAITKILFERTSALYACILIALFPCLVQYSQEYRMYSYFVLLAMLAAYLFLKAYEGLNVLCGYLFVACSLLTMYNHFLGLIPIFSLYVYGAVLLTYDAAIGVRAAIVPRIRFLAGSAAAITAGYLFSLPRWATLFSYEEPMGGENVFTVATLERIFGDYLGIGTGTIFWIVASLACFGLIAAVSQRPRFALLGILWIAIPLLMLHVRGGSRMNITTSRYLIFLYPIYLIFLAHGLAQLSNVVRASVQHFSSTSGAAGEYARHAIVLGFIVVLLAPPLRDLYRYNHKPLPVDLRDGYADATGRMAQDDVLLEGVTAQGGNADWFRFYDAYFLRNKSGLRKSIIDQYNFPAFIKTEGKRSGRLWILLIVGQQESELQRSQDSGFDIRCHPQICLLTEQTDSPRRIADQAEHFFSAFERFNPEGFRSAARAVAASQGSVD
jgi:hypothetical protein